MKICLAYSHLLFLLKASHCKLTMNYFKINLVILKIDLVEVL